MDVDADANVDGNCGECRRSCTFVFLVSSCDCCSPPIPCVSNAAGSILVVTLSYVAQSPALDLTVLHLYTSFLSWRCGRVKSATDLCSVSRYGAVCWLYHNNIVVFFLSPDTFASYEHGTSNGEPRI